MKTFIFLSIFAIIVLSDGEKKLYHFQSYLGNTYFHPVNGTLKLYVHRPGWSKDFLRLNETKLLTGQTYLSAQFLNQNIRQINDITFYWTLSSPIPPKYILKKPSIYLSGIKIIPTYIKDLNNRTLETRNFCHKDHTPIKHKQEVKLVRC